jgi:hypothetical protein
MLLPQCRRLNFHNHTEPKVMLYSCIF